MAKNPFRKRVVSVMGVEVKVDVSTLVIEDIDEAQRHASPLIAYWASVWAGAEGEKESADATYRSWRAKCTLAIMEKDPKLAEYKVKAHVEAHPDFLKLKNAMAKATDHALSAKGMYEACLKRANQAQSLGASAREELSKTGSATRAVPDSGNRSKPPKHKTSPEDKSRLKGILGKKKEN